MATITRADLIVEVAEHLSILQAGETLNAEDHNKIGKAVDSTHEELQELGVAYWTTATIPKAVVGALKRIVAADVAHAFMSKNEADSFQSVRLIAEHKLREITAEPDDLTIIPNTYF